MIHHLRSLRPAGWLGSQPAGQAPGVGVRPTRHAPGASDFGASTTATQAPSAPGTRLTVQELHSNIEEFPRGISIFRHLAEPNGWPGDRERDES